jgi:hypothetical protein
LARGSKSLSWAVNVLNLLSFDCSRESSDFNSSFNDGAQVEFTGPDEVQVGH